MIKVATHGIDLVIDDERLDDWELLEKLADYDAGNGGLIVDIMRTLLGADQYENLKAAVKIKYGRVSSKAMVEAFNDVMKGAQNAKN